MFSSPAIVIVILMIIAHSDAHCVGTINEFAFLSTNKQKSKFRNFRKLFLKRHFEKQKTKTQKVAHRLRDWLMISGCESMCDSSAVDVGSCARECSAAPVKLGERTTAREGERARAQSGQAYVTLLLSVSLSACALWRARALCAAWLSVYLMV